MTEAELLATLTELYDSPEYVIEPEWDEVYFDPDDTYGTLKY